MRTIITLTLAAAAAAFGAVGDVISSFPLPTVCAQGEGMTWDGSYLWVCAVGPGMFYRLTTVGSITSSFYLGFPYGYFEGAAFDGEYLWCGYQRSLESPQFRRFTTDGSFVSGFTGRGTRAGMTYENGHIWGAQFKYTTAGSYLGSFTPPWVLRDLAWDGHYFWTWGGGYEHLHEMCQLTTTGSLVSSFALPIAASARGTEFDGQYLWAVVGNQPPMWVYQFDIGVVDVGGSSFGKIKALYR